jgi:hypothetical protein
VGLGYVSASCHRAAQKDAQRLVIRTKNKHLEFDYFGFALPASDGGKLQIYAQIFLIAKDRSRKNLYKSLPGLKPVLFTEIKPADHSSEMYKRKQSVNESTI